MAAKVEVFMNQEPIAVVQVKFFGQRGLENLAKGRRKTP